MNKKLLLESSSISSLNIFQEPIEDYLFDSNKGDEFDNKSSNNLIGMINMKNEKPKISISKKIEKFGIFRDLNLSIKTTRVFFMMLMSSLMLLSFFIFIPISQTYINFRLNFK